MKRTIIALLTLITTTLIYQHPKKSLASDPIPPSLIGVWKDGRQHTLGLKPDGSFWEVNNRFGPPGGPSGDCSTVASYIGDGNFTINGNEITRRYQTIRVEHNAACANGFIAQTSLPQVFHPSNNESYNVDSISFQNNGQTLVLMNTGGSVKRVPQIIYQKHSSTVR